MSFLIPFDFHEDDRLEDMTVIKPIGRGGSGDLYLVRADDGAVLALKVIRKPDNEGELNGIERCRALASEIPGLVPVRRVGKLPDGRLYCAMEPADNLAEWPDYDPDTLGNRIRRNGRIPPDRVLDWAASILTVVKALHAAGLAHCDLKPENILFVGGRPMLTDFGLVRDSLARQTDSPAGTAGYVPPEMVANPTYYAPMACDLYALGKIIYCAWSGSDVKEFPSVPKDAPLVEIGALRPLYMTACCSAPFKRFRSADDFLAAVVAAQARLQRNDLARPLRTAARAVNLLLAVLAVLCVFLFAANVAFAVLEEKRTASSVETEFMDEEQETDEQDAEELRRLFSEESPDGE